MEFVATSHNNQALVYNDYIYFHKKTNKNGSLIWRCQQKCGVTYTTIWNGVTYIFIRHPPVQHNHNQKLAEKEVEFEDFAASCPRFDNIRSRIQKIRRKDTPILPKSRANIQLDGIYIKTLYKRRFLLYDTSG